jgi:ubiquinone biosynthesis monooxygenase Coq7
MIDQAIQIADNALRTLSGGFTASRPSPLPEGGAAASDELSAEERSMSGALMRVNHVGEVCAQALYAAQALATDDPALRRSFEEAAREEGDHLAWTRKRLHELGSRPSLLNPLWYAGSFAIGWAAGRAGKSISLGFVVETERQVERHLDEHLDRLPKADRASRAIVTQMKLDEARHGSEASQAGAADLPAPIRLAMKAVARVMTTTAHRF